MRQLAIIKVRTVHPTSNTMIGKGGERTQKHLHWERKGKSQEACQQDSDWQVPLKMVTTPSVEQRDEDYLEEIQAPKRKDTAHQ